MKIFDDYIKSVKDLSDLSVDESEKVFDKILTQEIEENKIIVSGGQENMSRAPHSLFYRENKKLDESNRSDNLGIDITTYIDNKKSSISSSNLLDDNFDVEIIQIDAPSANLIYDEGFKS